jgi:polysaccharide biosynthesis/export protein
MNLFKHRASLFVILISLGISTFAKAQGAVGEALSQAPAVDYQLRPSDLLQVKVFQEEDLTREISVSQEYTISLPLIGTVDVRNLSPRQLEDTIRKLYDRDYLVNPQVSLIVLKYAERVVNVMGAVNTPQPVMFPSERGLTLLDAIARAGGFNRLANKKNVKITRTDTNGNSTAFTVNVEKLLSAQSNSQWLLQVDDVIFVDEIFL